MDTNIQFNTYLQQMERFCDYQERCLKDVEDKLIKLEVTADMHQKLIDTLLLNKSFDNIRYAKAFTSGKFRFKKWGRKKIFYALKQKRIDDKDIFNALLEIDEDEYLITLKELIDYKINKIGDISEPVNKKKTLNFALQKGYESNLIWDILNNE
ncbi:MAG: RecX family transcriptional regulator [Bacteroidetes bacterium]|nr:MAG: RecX family transcriptional regulator [Bacteroidota bacterium]